MIPAMRHRRIRGCRGKIRAFAVAGLMLLPPPGAAWAHGDEAAAPAKEEPHHASSVPRDPLFFLAGSDNAWTISESALGCLLVSPSRSSGTRLALGHHASHGRGIFLIGLSLSVPDGNPDEPVVLAAGGRDLGRQGRVIARDVFFIPLSRADVDLVLRELWYAGALWVTVRETAMSEGGLRVKEAVEAYGHACGAKDTAP
jgi:hypothetical protein